MLLNRYLRNLPPLILGVIIETQAALAQAKFDAPDDIATGGMLAVAKGDVAGEGALDVEGTANVAAYLVTQGYSCTGATAEAIALSLHGFLQSATNTSSSSAPTRTQQITDIAQNEASNPIDAVPTSTDPLMKIFETLIESKSGTAIDQSLTSLDALYGGRATTVSVNKA